MKWKTFLIGLGMVAVSCAYGLYMQPQLPKKMPVHWNAAGQVDRYGSQVEALYLVPGISVFLLVLLWVIPKISPKGKGIESFQAQYDVTVLALTAFMATLQIGMVLSSVRHFDMMKLVMGGMCLLFMVLGNLMGKITRNYWMGIRTPWTLESDVVWEKTHRLAARVMVVTSLIGLLISLLTPWPFASIILLLGGAIYPVFYSYFVYREVTPGGGNPASP